MNVAETGTEELQLEIQKLKTEIDRMSIEIAKKKSELSKLTYRISGQKVYDNRYRTHLESEDMKALLNVPEYNIGKYKFIVDTRQLVIGNESISLTIKESLLLTVFAANINNLLNRNYILETVWGSIDYKTSRSMDVYICRLRRFLSEDRNIHLVNFHGEGYKMMVTLF